MKPKIAPKGPQQKRVRTMDNIPNVRALLAPGKGWFI
jgi:hypothetical protein